MKINAKFLRKPIERLVVTLAACCTIKEVHRLKLFFVSLERERKKVAR